MVSNLKPEIHRPCPGASCLATSITVSLAIPRNKRLAWLALWCQNTDNLLRTIQHCCVRNEYSKVMVCFFQIVLK